MSMTRETCEQLIRDPMYSHSRHGDRLHRDGSWIYHRQASSPTGVICVGFATDDVHDPILRALRDTSSLSPTERR